MDPDTIRAFAKILTRHLEEAARQLASNPSDDRLQEDLRVQIQKILRGDQDLARVLDAAGSTSIEVHGSGAAAAEWGVAAGAGGLAVQQIRGNVYLGVPPKDDSNKAVFRTAYLERLIQQAGYLSLDGIYPVAASAGRPNLDAVYTALLTLMPFQTDLLRTGDWRRNVSWLHPALAQLNQHKYLLLLGDPGSGKTTFVNFVTVCMAGEILGREDVNLKVLRAPLQKKDEKNQALQAWGHGVLLPVRVNLRDFAARVLPKQRELAAAHHLWEFIVLDLTESSLEEFAPILKNHLLGTGGLLLLDGLDEVPEDEYRRKQIRDIVLAFVKSFSRCRVLLTSRSLVYKNQDWRLPGFAEAVIAPLTKVQIELFVSRWYSHLGSHGRAQGAKIADEAELKRAIFSSERLYELAESPLLLAMMANLHARQAGSLPEKLEQLYGDAVEMLLNLRDEERVVLDAQGEPLLLPPNFAEWLKADRGKVQRVLEELAFEAHSSQPESEGTADIFEKDLVFRLLELSSDRKVNPEEIKKYLAERAGLMVERRKGVYALSHRTFQEYLAACYLTRESSYPDRLADLARKDPNRWRGVVLLAGAAKSSAVWNLAQALCWREPMEEPGAEDIWGAHLAGQAVVESVDLEQVSGYNRQHLKRLQLWHVHLIREPSLPATERAMAGRSLARLGDLRFDREGWFLPNGLLLGCVEVPAGPFLMGEGEQQHAVVLPAYWIGRFPVTVQQFQFFVRASGYAPGDPRWPRGTSNAPVSFITWFEALDYCRWLGEQAREILPDGYSVTLPSEAEWEKAARGMDGRIFPWGNEEEPDRANYNGCRIDDVSPVGCFSLGASVWGCEELSGNVWEWVRSIYAEYPYDSSDGREELSLDLTRLRGLRGGSYRLPLLNARCAARGRSGPLARGSHVGFRIALSRSSSEI